MRIGKIAVCVAVTAIGITGSGGAMPIAAAASSVSARDTNSAPPIIRTNNFAGYATSPGPSSGMATFKVPRITCTSASAGISPGVYMSAGTVAGLLIYCYNGVANYEAYFVINNGPATYSFTVNPGDLVTVSASESVAGSALTVKDLTSHAKQGVSGPGAGITQVLPGVALMNVEGDQNPPPATFKTVPFTKVTVGGKSLSSATPAEVEWVSGATVLLKPSAITGGNAFTVVFKHS